MQTFKWACALVFLLSSVFISWNTANAAYISYALTDLGAQQQDLWQIDYQVSDFDSDAYDNLLIYFDYAQFENLSVVASPSAWDVDVNQPDAMLGAEEDGELDAMVLSPGGILSASFSVQTVYLGTGMPGAQAFDLYNSANWEDPVASGTTSPVPVPGAFVLMLSGLAGLAAGRRKFGNKDK